ncbi:hypothetical protein ACK3TF_000515 [Chlorella vulgaris]
MLLPSLRRLAAACGPSALSKPSITAAVAIGSSSSSSSAWNSRQARMYADETGDKPAEEAAAESAADGQAAAAGGEAAEDSSDLAIEAAEEAEDALVQADVPDALIDNDGSTLTPEMFSKRQLKWMGLDDPEKTKHFLPALSRKELGSFADEYHAERFDVEQELYPTIPEDVPLYDIRDVVPEIYQPRSELFERLVRLKQSKHPDMPLEEFAALVLGDEAQPEEAPPRPGARRIIRWRVRHVLSVGVTEGHPANRRVQAWVYLRDLQREHGLTDAALQHIALVCGQRYNPNRGELKLSCDRYPHREANRARIMQIIADLVAEGHRKHPAAQQQQQQQQPQQQTAGT